MQPKTVDFSNMSSRFYGEPSIALIESANNFGTTS